MQKPFSFHKKNRKTKKERLPITKHILSILFRNLILRVCCHNLFLERGYVLYLCTLGAYAFEEYIHDLPKCRLCVGVEEKRKPVFSVLSCVAEEFWTLAIVA